MLDDLWLRSKQCDHGLCECLKAKRNPKTYLSFQTLQNIRRVTAFQKSLHDRLSGRRNLQC